MCQVGLRVPALALLLLGAAAACERSGPSPLGGGRAGAEPAASAAALAPQLAERCRDRERISFVVTADTHFGASPEIDARNLEAIGAMNTMPGRAWPEALGGSVGDLCGVLVAGDLTEDGKPEQWDAFAAAFGLAGGDGKLEAPVFETIGNHDKHAGFHVRNQIVERHGSTVYAFDWGKVHVVSLGEAPDDTDLAWLRRDLDAAPQGSGIVLFFHFPLLGAYSRGQWFGDGPYRDALADVLRGRDVLAIFHGHYHATGLYTWNDIDVYRAGSPKHGWHTFNVVEIGGGSMKVASWDYDADGWRWFHQKPALGGDARVVKRTDPGVPP
jgi:cytolysin (calcineurin-like family phosphatase)